MNYYTDFLSNTSPMMDTPFLDSSSTVETPYLDHFDTTSEEFMSMIFGESILPPEHNDVYVAGYLETEVATPFNGDPNALLIDKSKTTVMQDTLFPPLMSQQQQQQQPAAALPVPQKKKKTAASIKPIKLYQCPYCDHKSKRRFNLNTHIMTHDKSRVKAFDCSKCPKRFDRRHDRDRHLATVHSPTKYSPCQFCNQRFSRSDALQRHLISKHDFCSFDFE